jgi:hypothetical protein
MIGQNIYGSIGYTLLKNDNHMIIVMADMHDGISSCKNKTNISEWFKTKFESSEIFLEEVPRDGVKLVELWDKSDHTQKLKNLYLKNPKIIQALDVRPMMIPYSWEILNNYDKDYDITLKQYLKKINRFFCLTDPYLMGKLRNYSLLKLRNTKLGEHFIKIKRKYKQYIKMNRSKLLKSMYDLLTNNTNILEQVNNILNDIMEWFICAKIQLKLHRPIIIHAGLFHTDNVIDWLRDHYMYNIIKQHGINTIEESESDNLKGCIELDPQINKMF